MHNDGKEAGPGEFYALDEFDAGRPVTVASEQELRQVMRRVDAPEGFAAGVLAKLPGEGGATGWPAEAGGLRWWAAFERRSVPGWNPWGTRGAIAAALLLTLLLPLFGYVHEQRQEREAAAAAEQFSLAMRVTEEALLAAGNHVAARRGEQAHPAGR